MSITMKEVREWLDADEVNYFGAKKLGSAAIPFLLELVQGGDLGLASKATYLASLIKSDQSVTVLETAAARNEPVLRVAAASGIGNLPKAQATRMFNLLINDPDVGIRKLTIRSAERINSAHVSAIVQQIAATDPEPFIRDLAASTVNKIKITTKSTHQ